MGIVNSTKIEHPSYAMASFCRFNGGKGEFFGANTRSQSGGVRLTISNATLYHSDTGDTIMANKPFVEVEMSNIQFADLITNMNTMGVPVTLVKKDGERIEPVPFEDKRELTQSRLYEATNKVAERIDHLTEQTQELLNRQKPLTKAEKQAVLNEIGSLKKIINDHIPYIGQLFAEEMDKVAQEARNEFTAYVHGVMQQAGVSNINELRLLTNKNQD